HRSPVASGHGAAREQRSLFGQPAHAPHVQPRASLTPHASRKMVSRPSARWIGGGADRAGSAMEHRAVGRVAAVPAVAPDAALESLALRHPDDVDQLARLEQLGRHLLSDLVALERLTLVEANLAHHARGLDVGLLEVTGHRLGDVLLLGLEAEL